MSALVFELTGKPNQRLDLSPLIPSRLKDLKPKEIEALSIGTTREKLTVGDAFKTKGNDASALRFVGTDARCDKIGAALRGELPERPKTEGSSEMTSEGVDDAAAAPKN